jgi:hypothetical protein
MDLPDTSADIFTVWICSRNLRKLTLNYCGIRMLFFFTELQLKPEHKPIQHLNDWKRKIVQLLTTKDPSQEDAQLYWRRHASLNLEREKQV